MTATRLRPSEVASIGLVRRAARTGTARRVRELAGVTLEELAASCGVRAQTVLRWEAGTRSPRALAATRYTATIAALAASLDDEIDEQDVRELRAALADAHGAAP